MNATKLSGMLRFLPGLSRFALLLLLVWPVSAVCQVAGSAALQGTVQDATGAVIVNATVVAIEKATGVRHTAETGDKGLYSFPNLPVGTYQLDVTATGFQHYLQS